MKREADGAVGRKPCFAITMENLDIYILIERPREPVAG
jgi:hypothetical protein